MMEHLPMEMVIEITKHLSVKEIVICCAVSREWRDIFGSDMVWGQFCGEMIDEHLKRTPCRIKPKFKSPEHKDSTLTPIGHWRMAYMRKVHLLKNWIEGNHTSVEIVIEGNLQSFFFLTNDLLILGYTGFIVLMDTSGDSPVRMGRIELDKKLFEGNYTTVEVRSDLFVIRRYNIAQAIQVDLEAYVLTVKHTFYIDDGGVIKRFLGDVAVGNVLLMRGRGIHVFDLDNASKLKLELCPNGGIFINITCSPFCQDVIVISQAPLMSYHCYVYSVKELKFLQFQLTMHGPIGGFSHAIIPNYLAMFFYGTTKVYNYINSQLLFTFPEQVHSVGAFSTTFFFKNHAEMVSFHPHSGTIVRSTTFDAQGDIYAWHHAFGNLKRTLHKMIDEKLEIEPHDYVKLPTTFISLLVNLTPAHSTAVMYKPSQKRLLIYYFW